MQAPFRCQVGKTHDVICPTAKNTIRSDQTNKYKNKRHTVKPDVSVPEIFSRRLCSYAIFGTPESRLYLSYCVSFAWLVVTVRHQHKRAPSAIVPHEQQTKAKETYEVELQEGRPPGHCCQVGSTWTRPANRVGHEIACELVGTLRQSFVWLDNHEEYLKTRHRYSVDAGIDSTANTTSIFE